MGNNAPDYKDNLVFQPETYSLENQLYHYNKMCDYNAEYACKLEEKIRNQSIQLTRLEKKNNNKSENLRNLTCKHNKLKHFNKELYHKLKDFKKLEEKLHSIECILTSDSIEYGVRVDKALAKIKE